MVREIDRQIGASFKVLRTLCWFVLVKMELSCKVKLFAHGSMFLPSPMVMNF